MERATLDAYGGSQATISMGFELYVEDPADNVLKRVGELTSRPSMSNGQTPTIDVTNSSSRFIESIDGLSDPNSEEASFGGNFVIDDIGQKIVAQSSVDKADLNFEVRLPMNDDVGGTRSTATFSATVSNYDVTGEDNDAMKFTATLRKTSQVELSWLTYA